VTARRSIRRVLVVGLLPFLATGCVRVEKNTPKGYDATVQANFMSGCLANWDKQLATEITVVDSPSTTVDIPSGFPAGATDYCTCVYQGIEKDIPYADFKKIDSDLTKNLPKAGSTSTTSRSATTTAVPAKLQQIVNACEQSSPPPP
jgi:hypothetical protein